MRGAAVCALALLVPACAGSVETWNAWAGRILSEVRVVEERAAVPLRPQASGRGENVPGGSGSGLDKDAAVPFAAALEGREERLLDTMDVYALSPHAGLLALPRMVSADLERGIRSGRIAFPRPAEWQAMEARFRNGAASGTAPGSVPRHWEDLIRRAAAEHGLPPGLIAAVIRVESGFDPGVVSPRGAQGLMQLMPGTRREMGVSDPFDPEANVRGGCAYLRRQLDRFGSLDLALAAYNAGPGSVVRHNGVPPYSETRDYVRKVLDCYGR